MDVLIARYEADSSSLTPFELNKVKDYYFCKYLEIKGETEMNAPIENLSIFPVRDLEIEKFFKFHESLDWKDSEHDFSKDLDSYNSLSDRERGFFNKILVYFLMTDGGVSQNIKHRFIDNCPNYETMAFFTSQDYREMVHALTYGTAMMTYTNSQIGGLLKLVIELKSKPAVVAKINYLRTSSYNPETPLWELYLIAACTEGIHFSSLFTIIFHYRRRNLFPSFVTANEQISRDESIHRDFNALLYLREISKIIKSSENPSQEAERIRARSVEIVLGAIEVEYAFIDEIMEEPILDMTKEKLKNYVRVVSDNLLYHIQIEPIFNEENQCTWTDEICVDQHSNFYDLLVVAYHTDVRNYSSLDEETVTSDIWTECSDEEF